MVYDEKDIEALVEHLKDFGYFLLAEKGAKKTFGPGRYTLNANNKLLKFLKDRRSLSAKDFNDFEPVQEDFTNVQYYRACAGLYWNFQEVMFEIDTTDLPRHLHEENTAKKSLVLFRIEQGK